MMELVQTGITIFISAMASYFLLRERIVKLETLNESRDERVKAIEARVDEGNKTMQELNKALHRLNVNIARLSTKLGMQEEEANEQ